ncbi:MAG: terminase small subunit [Bacteroidaceae bacterium]|nr:terminase small subunit [Bacteroidaceae bacterium]
MAKLTDKQKRFIEAYIGEAKMNATQAAKIAGYKQPHVQGAQNLSKLSVYIQKATEERSSKAIMKQDEILAFFSSVARGEEKEKVMASNGKVEELPVSVKDRLKAAELMGKAYAMFTEKRDVKVELPTLIDDIPGGDEDD